MHAILESPPKTVSLRTHGASAPVECQLGADHPRGTFAPVVRLPDEHGAMVTVWHFQDNIALDLAIGGRVVHLEAACSLSRCTVPICPRCQACERVAAGIRSSLATTTLERRELARGTRPPPKTPARGRAPPAPGSALSHT